jgi:NAD(P)H-dependent flavin oxidoreductase YrpB (nitropropane dioxygenase family)
MSFLDQLGLEHPIVQAGMGGGIATGALAGEVSAAGGLGTVGMLPADQLRQELGRARDSAGRAPVAANLLVPFATRDHVRACLDGGARLVVLHAGFKRGLVEELRAGGAMVLPTVGTPEETRRVLAEGADGVVLQGVDAGGHLVGIEPALQALPAVLDAGAGAPVLLAGGIADHDDVRGALDAGAAAVVAGTRFLLTHESAAHPEYKHRVLGAKRTIQTQLFGLGWPMRHRVVPNAATERWCRGSSLGPRALLALYRVSPPLGRLPMSLTRRTAEAQHPAVPLFSPAPPLAGMPDRIIDASALYAGETALRIDELVSAVDATRLLARGSPTISAAR